MLKNLVVSIPDLIDMAVGSTELNLSLLNAVLHIFSSQVAMESVRVQLKGMVPITNKAPQSTKLPNTFTVFTVNNASPDGQLDINKCNLVPRTAAPTKPVNTLFVMDHANLVPQPYRKNDIVEKSLPNTSDLVKACRGDDGRMLLNMLDLLTITKRIEATELTIEKIMTMLCELCKDKVQGPTLPDSNANDALRKEVEDLRVQLSDMTSQMADLADLPMRMDRLVSLLERQKRESEDESKTDEDTINSIQLLSDLEARIARIELRCRCARVPSIDSLHSSMEESNREMESNEESLSEGTINTEGDKLNLDVAQELKKEHDDVLRRVSYLEQQDCTLQNEMVRLFSLLEDHAIFAKSTRCQLLELINRVEDLKHNVHGLNVDVNMLVRERMDRMRQYEALIDQLEQIKCVKADREEVEQMVIVKADITDMRTKVPYSVFEDVKKDLSLSLIDALEKIVETDLEWHRAIEAIHELLQLKLDKTEAASMAEDLTQRMIALKDKLRGFGMFRLSCESAATTQKFLKDVKCIACNAQTYMQPTLRLPEIPRMGKFGRIPDPEVRQFARITVPCSMRYEIKEPQTVKRFCGGLHTKIADTEKHSVKGHFIKQTGGVPLSSNATAQMARGTDGAFYRVDLTDCNCREFEEDDQQQQQPQQ